MVKKINFLYFKGVMMKNFLKLFLVLIITGLPVLSAENYDYVKARHILVNSEADALRIKKSIEDGGSFAYYAQKYSICPSGKNGGELGYFGRGQMVRPFEEAAFNLPEGKVSEPIKTQFGWHLIEVEDKK